MVAVADSEHVEYPPRADLRKDVYKPLPAVSVSVVGLDDDKQRVQQIAGDFIQQQLNAALRDGSSDKLKGCFLAGNESPAYWRDQLALTYHWRTFTGQAAIAAAFMGLEKLRGIVGGGVQMVEGSANYVVAAPTLKWIDCAFTFKTASPAASCGGRLILLPQPHPTGNNKTPEYEWKIWQLCTWLDSFDAYPEDASLLTSPRQDLSGSEINTEVFILGAGNAGLILAARLKALGVASLIADRNAQAGDNWALRYDNLQFHVPKLYCDTPYLPYPEDVPQLPRKSDLSGHMRNYAAHFHLNILHSSTVFSTTYNTEAKLWTVRLNAPHGEVTVTAKHFVQATGIGSTQPYVPTLSNPDSVYRGVAMHSVGFKNAALLKQSGVESVVVVGSANTAFDVIEDCCHAGLQTTMIARSPTYMFPWQYALNPAGLGIYEHMPVEVADSLTMTGPTGVGGQMLRGLHASLASAEPDRYKKLREAGYPVMDSTYPDGDLMFHIVERAGGHVNEIGEALDMIVDGRVKVKGGVEPVAYTEEGLKLSDGSEVNADAILWCTGFADRNIKKVIAGMLGDNEGVTDDEGMILGAREIADRMDATWGIDNEGEIRGMWKRHLKMENFWVVGGTAAMHRYCSRFAALQIKAQLEGILPEAYRYIPEV
ncbi:hypothetical protein QBC46DRAFT_459705 [Diplogelasinospora grovesii]|uniref:Uncharacterized protein n=1 Tax=Diplogelasinospora grovesii TaxID=303347 RepID=A0AAN6S473_9PEZI|nr:hypothetical protein QBC46DRAFT_459705 [Diplogelasinospora grovesii]